MIKEENYLKKIAETCLTQSKKLGSSDASVVVMNAISENVNIRNKQLDGSERSDNLAVTLTTYIGKKKASISSSNFGLLIYNKIFKFFLFISFKLLNKKNKKKVNGLREIKKYIIFFLILFIDLIIILK